MVSSSSGLYIIILVVAISNVSFLGTLAKKHHGENPNHGCNIFRGRWVHVKKSSPPYNYTSCPFIHSEFDCQRNGRPDSLYLEFQWQPDECNLPRFNAHDFLTRFRGKTIMFVGDSLMLNQWQSLACLIISALPRIKYTMVQHRHDPMNLFHLHDYKISITMEWHQFLVEIVNGSRGRALKLDYIKGDEWRGADLLVFDSYHWWFYKNSNQIWDYMEVNGKRYSDLNRTVAFKIAMESWERWIDRNTNHTKTRVFYQGISPSHYRGKDWGQPHVKGCEKSKLPVQGHGNELPENPDIGIVKSVLSHMKHPAYFLDISRLSNLRPDAHPSIYGSTASRPHRAPGPGADCTHWCLPGLPDTWNRLLYATLLTVTDLEVNFL